jgi:two-component system invasion response regulator UvrY
MKKILIVDDHEVVREGIKRLFAEEPEAVFGEAADEHQACELVQEQAWDVAVLDISLRGRGGLEVLREIKTISPKLPVLILSMHAEEQYARRAFRAGAAGYATKDTPREDLRRAIQRVMIGGRYVSPALAEKMVAEMGGDANQAPHEILSDREFEVMRLIALGKTVGEIAVMLSLSNKTISTYRRRALEKLGVRTNAEIARYAIRQKLIE